MPESASWIGCWLEGLSKGVGKCWALLRPIGNWLVGVPPSLVGPELRSEPASRKVDKSGPVLRKGRSTVP